MLSRLATPVLTLLLCLPAAHALDLERPAGQGVALPGTVSRAAPVLPGPALSSSGALARADLVFPPGATYTLIPTFGGLRLDVRGVQALPAVLRPPNASLSEVTVAATPEGASILFLTPYPLSLTDGWRGISNGGSGGYQFLTLEFSAALVQGELQGTPRPLSQVSAEQVPPGDSAPPVVVPTTAPLPEAAGEKRNVLRGRVDGTADGRVALAAPRVGRHPGMTRVVLDLPPGTSFQISPRGRDLVVELSGVTAEARSEQGLSDELRGWQQRPQSGGAVVTLSAAAPLTERSGWRGVMLPPAEGQTHHRLAIDLSPAYADRSPLAESERRLPALPATRRASLPPGLAVAAVVASVPAPKPRVVLDPGHGGKFPGAVGAVVEKDLTLDVALRVRELLVAAGVEVVMTRDSDRHLHEDLNQDLRARAAMAAAPARVFVSIHSNSTVPERAYTAYGVETWWNDNHPHSRRLAATLQEQMLDLTGGYSRGVRSNQSLAVLRGARVPAALVEVGFGSHPVDGENLRDGNYLDRVAVGIAKGIHQMLLQGH